MKKIRFIVVGFGFMGQTHAATICSDPNMELAAVVSDIPKDKIKPVSGNVKKKSLDWSLIAKIPFFTTMEEAFEKVKADAVVIATPTVVHAQNIVSAAKAKKHIFVEKPMCMNMDEVEQIRTALKETDKLFQVGFVVRFSAPYKYVTQAVRENTYGALQFLDLSRVTGFPSWGAWSDPAAVAKTGGAILDLLIHDIDFALQLCGDPVRVVEDPLFFDQFKTTALNSSWHFAKGELVRIHGGFFMPPTFPFRAEFTAVFEKATFEYSSKDGQLKCHTSDGTQVIALTPNDCHQDELISFAECIKNGTKPEPDFAAGAKTIAWISKLCGK